METSAETINQHSNNDSDYIENLAGKFMIFKLDNERYGLQIIKVREIVGMMNITPVPQSGPFIRGVINLRGKIEPVLDLRAKFGMAQVESTDQTVIIVVQHGIRGEQFNIGIIVDEVLEVMNIGADAIERTPNFGFESYNDFILGVAKHEQRVVFLLDINQILDCHENAQLGEQSFSESEKTEH